MAADTLFLFCFFESKWLQAEAKKTEVELTSIRDATAESLWHSDLDKLDDFLRKKMKH